MVMTILEAQVLPQNVTLLKSAYAAAIQQLEAGMVETFLASDARNPALWRILTVWKDRQALDAMRELGTDAAGRVDLPGGSCRAVPFRAGRGSPLRRVIRWIDRLTGIAIRSGVITRRRSTPQAPHGGGGDGRRSPGGCPA